MELGGKALAVTPNAKKILSETIFLYECLFFLDLPIKKIVY